MQSNWEPHWLINGDLPRPEAEWDEADVEYYLRQYYYSEDLAACDDHLRAIQRRD